MGRFKQSIVFSLLTLPVLISVLSACGGSSNTSGPAATAQALDPTSTTVSAATQPQPSPTFAPRQLNLELEGDGPRVLEPITVNTGVMIAFVRYEGEGPFSMTFLGGEKGLVKSIDSSSGPYQGERVHSVFEAMGRDWSLESTQLRLKGTAPGASVVPRVGHDWTIPGGHSVGQRRWRR